MISVDHCPRGLRWLLRGKLMEVLGRMALMGLMVPSQSHSEVGNYRLKRRTNKKVRALNKIQHQLRAKISWPQNQSQRPWWNVKLTS